MGEQLYTAYPARYDDIQSDYDYDRDIEVIESALADRGLEDGSILEIGCGTGEHTRRLEAAGFDVTAVDKYEGMLEVAAEKCDARLVHASLPALEVAGTFDAVVAIRGVINHLEPAELQPAIAAIADHLEAGGVAIFDNSDLPPDGNAVGLDIGTTDEGEYARLAQHVALGDRELEWRSVMFLPDGDFFTNTRRLTAFRDETVAAALDEYGFTGELLDGFDSQDRRTVFVASLQ